MRILLVIALAVGAAIFAGYYWSINKDPQGDENSSCHSEYVNSVMNRTGMVVNVKNTVCDVSGGNSAVYVFIHKTDQKDSRNSLVFRYFDKYNIPPPTIEWINDSSVRISVGEVSQVTKQLPTIDAITVTYEIGKQDYPH